jgi:hypothetical protein
VELSSLSLKQHLLMQREREREREREKEREREREKQLTAPGFSEVFPLPLSHPSGQPL